MHVTQQYQTDLTDYICVCNTSFNVHMLLCTAYQILTHVLYAYVSVYGNVVYGNTMQCIHTHIYGTTQYHVSVYQQLHVLAKHVSCISIHVYCICCCVHMAYVHIQLA